MRSSMSISGEWRVPFATLLTNEGSTFSLRATLAKIPLKLEMILLWGFPTVRADSATRGSAIYFRTPASVAFADSLSGFGWFIPHDCISQDPPMFNPVHEKPEYCSPCDNFLAFQCSWIADEAQSA